MLLGLWQKHFSPCHSPSRPPSRRTDSLLQPASGSACSSHAPEKSFEESIQINTLVNPLKDSVQAALEGVELPIVVVAVLLPWMGRIVHQGQILIPKQLKP